LPFSLAIIIKIPPMEWVRQQLIAHRNWAVIFFVEHDAQIFFSHFSCFTKRLSSGYLKNNETLNPKPLPFTFKSILMQRKIYRSSNISPCKNIVFKKNL
jgi:hypothetical protein